MPIIFNIGRNKVSAAGKKCIGVGRRLVERRRLGIRGLGISGLGVRKLGVEGLGVGGLRVNVESVSSRHRGSPRAIALHVAKSVKKLLRFSTFLSMRPKFISGNLIGRSESLGRSLRFNTCLSLRHPTGK
jgi:hypothetical protein